MIPGVLPRGGDSNWILKNEYEMYELAQQAKACQAERRVSAEVGGGVRGKKHVMALGMVSVPGAGSLRGVVRCETGKAGWREVRERT